MNILYVVHSIPKYEQSGTPIACWEIAKRIKKNNKHFKVGFIIPFEKEGYELLDDIEIYKINKIDFHDNFFHDHNNVRKNFLNSIKNIFKSFNPDIVHIYNFVFTSYQILRIKEQFNNIRFIRTVTNIEDICFCVDPIIQNDYDIKLCSGPDNIIKCVKHYEQLYNKINYSYIANKLSVHYYYLEYIYNNIDKFIFTTNEFSEYYIKYIKIPSSKIVIISHGIDKSLFSCKEKEIKSNNIKTITYIGGFKQLKGINVLIEALKNNNIKCKINIMGNVDINSEFKNMLDDRYNILGLIKDEKTKINIIRQSDLVVLPTYFETFNLTLRESLALGTPTIVTNTFGSSIIKDGFNGYKIPIGDSHKLAEIIDYIFQNENELYKLTEGAMNTKIDTIEQETENILQCYYDVMKV